MSEKVRNYDSVASTYELASHIYSTGQIKAAKLAQLNWLNPGSKILYLGCGTGEDVIEAARRGFDVTAIDLSSKMIKRLQAKLEKQKLQVNLICGDVFKFDRVSEFDTVSANFFFNVFLGESLDKVINHALTLIRPDGCLTISDVALPKGWWPSRCFNWIYINGAQLSASVAGLVQLHRNHDYHAIFSKKGLNISETKHFRFMGIGPILFQSLKIDMNLKPDASRV